MAILVVLLVLMLAETVTSQSSNHINNTNIPILNFCGSIAPKSALNFNKNRNSTLNDIRSQLLNQNKLYARAQDLSGGDSVFAAAQCRNYLTVDQCVACFDAGVSVLVNCSVGNGAYVLFDNCFLR